MGFLVCAALSSVLVITGCSNSSSTKTETRAPEQDIVDAIHGQSSPKVAAAADVVAKSLSADEVRHIDELDWTTVTADALLADETYMKGLAAVLSVVDVPTQRTLPPLELQSEGQELHVSDNNVCNLNCDECRRYLQHAIATIQNALKRTAQEGLRCYTPACAGAILLKSAELTTALMYATFCLAATSTLSQPQRQSVVTKLSSCRKLDCGACPKCDADLSCRNDANGKIVKGSCTCSGCFYFSDSRCCNGNSSVSPGGCGPYP